MTLQELIQNKDYVNLYILARYFYRIGEPFIDDKMYDQIERLLKCTETESSQLGAYFSRTYDDDPVPVELLNQLGIKPAAFVNLNEKSDLFSYLDEEKSMSIESAVSYDEAFEYFKFLRAEKLDFMASLKMDGDNTKMLYVDSEFALSVSRGRNGEAFDFTANSAKVMPRFIESSNKYMKVIGESYVLPEKLEYLRQKYDPGKYKTSKSAAMSLLRVAHEREDYQCLSTRVFYAEGLSDTLQGMFEKLEGAGVATPPHRLINWEVIPDNFSEFKIWLKNEILDWIYERSSGIPSDGVVIEVNDLLWSDTQKNQYSNRQHALKFDHWGFKYSKGVISNIHIEQRRVYKSVRVEIDPVVTYDGCEATYINTFDPSILISNDLYVGKEVYFERNSGAVNILIHGQRLHALKESEQLAEVEG